MSQDKPVLTVEQVQLQKKRIQWMMSGESVAPPNIKLTLAQEVALCDLALSALERQGSGWISVEERLPKDHEVVIVNGGIAYRRNDYWMTLTGEEWPGRPIQWNVTHWMPLPPSPQAQDAQTGEKK